MGAGVLARRDAARRGRRSPRCSAPLTERGLLRFFYGRDEVLLVLVTYALFLILEDVTKLIWGANPYFVSEPYGLFGNVHLGVQT